jgi:hypothetical protein
LISWIYDRVRPGVTDILDGDQFICSQTSLEFGFAQVNEISYQKRDGETIFLDYDFVPPVGDPHPYDDYIFTWYLDDGVNPTSFDIGFDTELLLASGTGKTSALLDFDDTEFVGAGTYWVIVKNNDPTLEGLECESQPFQFIIEDKTIRPTIAYEVTANTACDPNFADGTYPVWTGWTVTITQDDDPSTVEPRVLAATNNIGTEDEQFYITGALDGTYKFTIVDDATGCAVPPEEFQLTVPKQEDYPDVVDDISVPYPVLSPQYICNDDGSIEIRAINSIVSGDIVDIGNVNPPVAGVDMQMDNYTFTWYKSDDINALGAPIFSAVGSNLPAESGPPGQTVLPYGTAGNFLNPSTYVGMEQGSYWVVIAKNGPVPANPASDWRWRLCRCSLPDHCGGCKD